MNSGSWSAVMPWPLIGIHAALLPDGRILTFGSDQRGEQGLHKIYDMQLSAKTTITGAHRQ